MYVNNKYKFGQVENSEVCNSSIESLRVIQIANHPEYAPFILLLAENHQWMSVSLAVSWNLT